MELQLDLARKYAKQHLNKRVTWNDLAKAMWPDSATPYQNLYNLRIGKSKTFTCKHIEAIIRLTGIPINMLIQ